MKYISTIVRENKVVAKKKPKKKVVRKVITVMITEVNTRYLKVYADSQEEAKGIAKIWCDKEVNIDDKIVVDKDGYCCESLQGSVFGFTTEIFGKSVDEVVNLSED
jgi:hypothetical protein